MKHFPSTSTSTLTSTLTSTSTSTLTLTLTLLLLLFLSANAENRHVGTGQTYDAISQAANGIQPGDTITVHQGTYAGGWASSSLKGTASKPIVFMAAFGEEVIYSGGGNAWQLTDAEYLKVLGFIFQGQTGNGVNFDDGGTPASPAHHITFESCIFRDINATGNNDLLKLSGIDQFEILKCSFKNGAAGGSGIDMVGCHDGLIKGCIFENLGSNSIQAKGGCKSIRIEGNTFTNGGQRAINMGGSTGLTFFRPIDAKYEASDILVYANIFIGSDAPVAFVGCVNSEVVNNTFYLPGKWVLRILQETVDTTRFLPCGSNRFANNIIYKNNQVSTDCNIGPNTAPQSFVFQNNLWLNSQNSSWTGPVLPATESNAILSKDPLFSNASAGDFTLQKNSPAIGKGINNTSPTRDFRGNPYLTPPSIGAYEGGTSAGILLRPDKNESDIKIYNPVFNVLKISGVEFPFTCEIRNIEGKLIEIITLEGENTPVQLNSGIYYIHSAEFTRRIVVIQ